MAGRSEFIVWGDGTPRRELLHVDDLAEAMQYLMRSPTLHDLYNVGSGHDLSISDLAAMIAEIVGFEGKIVYDINKPNGTMRKLLDSSRISTLGWKPFIQEKDGLKSAYVDFLERYFMSK